MKLSDDALVELVGISAQIYLMLAAVDIDTHRAARPGIGDTERTHILCDVVSAQAALLGTIYKQVGDIIESIKN